MKKYLKKLLAPFLALLIAANPVVVKAESGLSEYQRGAIADYYKNYPSAAIEDVAEMINEVYMGGDVTEEMLYKWALYGMTLSLDDYSDFFSEQELKDFIGALEKEQYIYGLSFTADSSGYIYINSIVENSPAAKQGLLPKDKVLRINGEPVSGLGIYDLMEILDRNIGGTCSILIERDGAQRTVNLKKEAVKNKTVKVLKVEEAFEKNPLSPEATAALKNVRYVSIHTIGEETSKEFKDTVAKLQAEGVTEIILDLRSNGGGYSEEAIEICKQLVPNGIIATRATREGKTVVKSTLEKAPFNKIVLLTDNYTASAAELISSALQDSGTFVVGQKTYGKGVGQAVIEIPGLGYLKLTVEEYFRRSGGKINQVGITPNLIVEAPQYIAIKDANEPKDIMDIEKALIYLGYNIKYADGIYDEETKAAVKAFKAANGLEANDVLNSVTKFALNQSLFDTMMSRDDALEKACIVLKSGSAN